MPKVIPHRHCAVCGKAVDPEEIFCSDKCRMDYESRRRRESRWLLIFFAIIIIFMLLALLRVR